MQAGWLERDGLRLAVWDRGGDGPVVVFQHGLGGDARQASEAVAPGLRCVTLDCRGHGASGFGGPVSIAAFADDVAALIETLPGPVVLGGISMGAAIALRLAVTRPELARALILLRPAWGVDAAPPNLAPNAEVGALLARLGADEALEVFAKGDTARRLAIESPDNLTSLLGFFDRAPQAVTAQLLSAISADGPGVSAAQVAALRLPALVCGCAEDAIHPLALAEGMAGMIPDARFVTLPPKGRGKAPHLAALHAAMTEFLKELPDA